MEQIKRKRGRPRKIPEEIQKVIDIVDETNKKEENEFHQVVEDVKQIYRGSDEWDVPLNQKIEFFDSRLSYELSGYKPINKEKGLDFNPAWFTEAAATYNNTGKYCQFAIGSKLYRDFWQLQYERCRDGMISHGYTITGDHYYFLNFYRLEDLTSAKKAGGGRVMSFPKFFVAQYEYFHYIELCKKLRKDAIGLKARGVNKPALS